MANNGVHALRQPRHVCGKVGRFQRGLYLIAIDIPPQRHVGGNTLVEHDHVLADHGYLVAQALKRPVLQRNTIEQHLPGARQYETGQQIDQRGFSRTGRTDKRHHFTRPDVQADLLQRRRVRLRRMLSHCLLPVQNNDSGCNRRKACGRLVRVRRLSRGASRCAICPISHHHVHKTDVPAGLHRQIGRCLILGFGLHALEHFQPTFQRSKPAGDGARHIGQAPDGSHQHQHGGHKGGEIAHGDRMFSPMRSLGLPKGDRQHPRQRNGRNRLGQRRHGRERDRRLERQLAQSFAQVGKTLLLLALRAVQPHHAMRQHVLLHHVGQLVSCLLRLPGQSIQPARKPAHHPRHAGRQHHHNHGEFPVEIQQITHQRNRGKAVT